MATVMVVDDYADIRTAVARIYRVAGHAVLTAVHGRDTLDQLEAGQLPDLILLDLMMPVMDGLSFLQLLREQQRWLKLRVVIYTAYDQGIQATRLRELGVGEILLKDAVDVDRLLALITC